MIASRTGFALLKLKAAVLRLGIEDAVLSGRNGSAPDADTDASECPLFHLCGCNLSLRTVPKAGISVTFHSTSLVTRALV